MRFHLLGLAVMASVAVPASAQRNESPERRIERLEQELRAVQRRVFPNGREVAPEIEPARTPAEQRGVPASTAVADMGQRLDSLEAQLREITGQAEQNANRLRQLEDQLARFRDSAGARLDVLERSGPASPAESKAAAALTPEPALAVVTREDPKPAAGKDPAEDAYNNGFRLWEARKYVEAQQALEGVAKRYPKSKWASWANNLAGRAYLDAGKPATAAKLFLSNYQGNPKGERAADSLYFLGQALVTLDKPADACKAYAELEDVYGAAMRDWLKQRLPAARAEAKCR